MIEPIIKYIDERNLTFANGQFATDPRDGLMLFGPFDSKRIRGQASIGIVGPCSLRIKMQEYLRSLHGEIRSKMDVKKHPSFHGLESIFGIYINFDNIPEIEISLESINGALKYADPNIRVHKLVNLYVDQLRKYYREQEIPVSTWIVVIPETIFTYGRPKSKIKKTEDTITARPSKDFILDTSLNIFPEFREEEQ